MLEIDLEAIDQMQVKTDPNGGQNGTSRQYIYDLPTLDDPTVANDGVREDADGMDVAGPWGGNDGFNMAVLPADAPIRVYADGFRNHYDLARDANGRIYTWDNGSNNGLGADPNTDANGEAISTPNNQGAGDNDALFLIEEGGYYGHPNPVRSNQDQSWTVYDDNGNADGSLAPNNVPDISELVPDVLNIEEGYLIDPSKFAAAPGQNLDDLSALDAADRLTESGIRIPKGDVDSPAIAQIKASTNGIAFYDSNGTAFGGTLDGALLAVDLSGNLHLVKLAADGVTLLPITDEGPDGLWGTADDTVVAGGADGEITIANSGTGVTLGGPLDVTVGPDGTIWIVEIGSNEITVLAPSELVLPGDTDADDDGLLNHVDPFSRDPSNGHDVLIVPGQQFLWDFDPDQDGNLPGPAGFGGGLTGHMVNGSTDYEQTLDLTNVKFTTAAGGGNIVIEEVSNGDPHQGGNNGEYLLHTGVTFAENVGTATITWSMFNPAAEITGNYQQIGAYIGTGDQSNFLKVVALSNGNSTGMQVGLEIGDGPSQTTYPSLSIFDVNVIPDGAKIFIELTLDLINQTATPVMTYETDTGDVVVSGAPVDLSGTAIMDAILGDYTVNGQPSGLAVGLFSTNNGEPVENTFQAIFDDIEINATEAPLPPDAVDDELNTPVDAVLVVPVGDLLANDTDPNPSDTLTVVSVGSAINGTVELINNDTQVLFTPTPGYEGEASFEYTISDGLETDSATAIVNVADRITLYRVNAGGEELAASDGGPNWSADTGDTPSPFLSDAGSNNIAGFPVAPGATVPEYAPDALFTSERWDGSGGTEMQWAFDVPEPGLYEVNLFLGNGYDGTSQQDQRVFDVSIEGEIPANLDDLDLSGQFGHQVGMMLTNTVEVTDGVLNILFSHITENPLINGIEIVQVGTVEPPPPAVNILNTTETVDEAAATVLISLATDVTVPNDEQVDITFEIASMDGATPGAGGDYQYNSPTATFSGGVYTDTVTIQGGSSDVQIPIEILDDLIEEGAEAFSIVITSVSPNAELGTDTSAQVTINPSDVVIEPGDILFRINAGGPEVVATDGGPNWEADQSQANSNGSAETGTPSPYLVDRGVANDDVTYGFVNSAPSEPGVNTTGAPDELFVTERFSTLANPENIGYAFDVENGEYTVNLYFDEIYHASANARVFDVEIEGELKLDDFDPFVANGNDSILQSFTVTVTDGQLNIEFLKGASDNPHISAIEIVAAGEAVLPTLSVGDPIPQSVEETGDSGATVLGFPISFDFEPAGSVVVSLEININGTITPGQITVLPTGTVAEVSVSNDDVDNGTENVSFTITGIISGEEYAVLGSQLTGVGEVTEDEVTLPPPEPGDVLFRVNVGGPEIVATDGGPNWGGDEGAPGDAANSPYLVSNSGAGLYNGNSGSAHAGPITTDGSVPATTPINIFNTERYDAGATAPDQTWAFPVATEYGLEPGDVVEVRLYFAELYSGVDIPGERVFDASVDGVVPAAFDDVDQIAIGGPKGGFMRSVQVEVDEDGNIDISLIHGVENPALKGIEIVFVEEAGVGPDSFNGVAAPNDDFTGDNADPDDYILQEGVNTIVAAQFPGDDDFITIEVPEGQQLVSATLTDYVGGTNGTFLGIQTGDTFPDEDDLFGMVEPLDGGTVYFGDQVGDDILPLLASGEVEGEMFPTNGLSLPLGPGVYTLWFGQNGFPESETTLELVTEPIADDHDVTTPVDVDGDPGGEVAEDAVLGAPVGITAFADDFDLFNSDVSYNLTDDAGGRFDIDPVSGVVTVLNPTLIDFESDTSHSIFVQATSEDGSTADAEFTIIVTDINEGGVTAPVDFDPTANSVDEGIVGATVGVTAFAMDPDPSDSVEYSLLGPNSALFTIDGAGVVTTAAELDRETMGETIDVEVTAVSTDGSSETETFTIEINDVDEFDVSTPVDVDGDTGGAISEDASNGDVVGVTALATDDDATTNGVTYSLTDDAEGRFTIDPLTGVVTVADAALLDYDIATSHDISVTAISDDGSTATETFAIAVEEAPDLIGAARIFVTVGVFGIQSSTFGANSFQIENIGDKPIASVEIDVTNALYPDSVFDPYGVAGDTLGKELNIDNDGGTGVVAPSAASYVGAGGIDGFEGLLLEFEETDNGGFEPGETVGFSVDMDPNSIAGADKGILESGADPAWDIGGVSGAELIGSTFTITFTDGTTATGQLMAAAPGDDAGAQGLVTQAPADLEVTLTVNGNDEGEVGTYSDGGPTVVIEGPAGETARVVLTKGVIQPVDNNFSGAYADQLDAQLEALANSDFPANNAAEFQIVDVVLTGAPQDISNLFDFSEVADMELAVDESQLPLGFVAGVIDPNDDGAPQGPVSAPIYLSYEENNGGLVEGDVLLRINAFGPELAAIDGGPNWLEDSLANPIGFFSSIQNRGDLSPGASAGAEVDGVAPDELFQTVRSSDGQINYDIPTDLLPSETGFYKVNLYFIESFYGTDGSRVFDAAVEDATPESFDNIDPFALFGNTEGGVVSTIIEVTDGVLSLDILTGALSGVGGVQNPVISGVEIIEMVFDGDPALAPVDIDPTVNAVDENAVAATVGVTAFAEELGEIVSYELIGENADLFSIDGMTGEITTAVALDRETLETVTVTVRAVSTSDSEGFASFEIAVNDVNETQVTAPLDVDAAENVVSEEAFDGAVVGVTAFAEDVDATTNNVTYTLTDDAEGRFAIDPVTGVVTVADASLLDATANPSHTIEVQAESEDGSVATNLITINVVEGPAEIGAATLEVTVGLDNVQGSNFGNNSFVLTNVGDKVITSVEIDVTEALYPDSVFDPFGLAGDTTGKELTISTPGGTGIQSADAGTYVGDGGALGFEAVVLNFDVNTDDGFESGESVGFAIDMDPNSIAGALKSILDSGAIPAWDIGGVSGAELIGSTFTVTFADGSTATGQLGSAGNQGGSLGLATQDSPELEVSLTVNGLAEGGVGEYSEGGPSVIVNGPAGETARVVLTKGIIQPVENNFTSAYADQLDAQLEALANSDFPANNAAEFQIVDVVLTGAPQDISHLFDFDDVPGYQLAVPEDQVPLGFVASVVDTDNDNLPMGPVTSPIYLTFEQPPEPVVIELEAEDIIASGFVVESQGVASEGEVASLLFGSTPGALSHVFDGGAGVWKLDIIAHDEADGVGQVQVRVNGQLVDSFTLNQQLGSNVVSNSNRVTLSIDDLELENGDVVEITGVKGGEEYVRLDKIVFTSQGDIQPPANLPPEGDIADAAIVIGTPLAIDLDNAFTDPNGDALSYQVSGPGAAFATLTGSQLVIDPPVGSAGDYSVTVTASDGEFSTPVEFTYSVTDEPPPIPVPFEVEAEDIISSGYLVEQSNAGSGGEIASLLFGEDQGALTYIFSGVEGAYDLDITAFDESDGVGQIEVRVNGVLLEAFALDGNTGSGVASNQSRVVLNVSGLELADGDVIEITGIRGSEEYARIDKLNFTPVDGAPAAASPQSAGGFDINAVQIADVSSAIISELDAFVLNPVEQPFEADVEVMYALAHSAFDTSSAYVDAIAPINRPTSELAVDAIDQSGVSMPEGIDADWELALGSDQNADYFLA